VIFLDIRKSRNVFKFLLLILFICAIYLGLKLILDTKVSLIPVDIKYKEYTGLDNKFTYRLPEEWKTSEQKFEGNEIIYHNDFTSEQDKLHGFVQVWNASMPLAEFLNKSRESAVGVVYFKDYSIEPAKINGKTGYILNYTRSADNDKYIKALEVFILQKDNVFIRFAFYMDETLWKDEYRELFLSISASSKF
jgi:hypothetical protein